MRVTSLLITPLLLSPLWITWAGTDRASAHPTGDITTSQYAGLWLTPNAVLIDHVVDLAEVPAHRAIHEADRDHDGSPDPAELELYAVRACTRVAAATRLRVAGVERRVTVFAHAVDAPIGGAGLRTLRLECALRAPAPLHRSAAVDYRNNAFPGGVGWNEVTVTGDRVAIVASTAPPHSASARLTAYPSDALTAPTDMRKAFVRVRPGGMAQAGVLPGPGGVAAHPGTIPAADHGLGTDTAVARRDPADDRDQWRPALAGWLALALGLLAVTAFAFRGQITRRWPRRAR